MSDSDSLESLGNSPEALRDWQLIRLDRQTPITVATKNIAKFREVRTLWGAFEPPVVIAGTHYPVVEELGDTYEANAVLKAVACAELCDGPALADDSGIEVQALNWGPGIFSARTPWPEANNQQRNAHILAAAEKGARAARFVCVCALMVPGFMPVVARGEVDGFIAPQASGTNGFGYDPIFYYPAYGATFADVEEEKKHVVSHRGRAIRALQSKISSLRQ